MASGQSGEAAGSCANKWRKVHVCSKKEKGTYFKIIGTKKKVRLDIVKVPKLAHYIKLNKSCNETGVFSL